MRFHKTILPMGESAVDRHNSFLRADEFLFDRHVCHVIGTAAAIGIGVAGAVGSVASGAIGAHAAGSAANAAANASLEGTKLTVASNEKMYNQTRSDQLPYMAGGAAALGRLDYELGLPNLQSSTQAGYKAGFGPQGSAYIPSSGGNPVVGYGPPSSTPAMNPGSLNTFQQGVTGKAAQYGNGDPRTVPGQNGKNAAAPAATTVSYTADPSYGSLMHDFSASDFQTDPGYEFRLSEGQKALDRSAAARGGLFSGEQLKANDQYNQNFASNEFGNAYNRFQNNRNTRYNYLSNAAGGGQVATNQVGQAGAQYASNIGNAYMTGYGNAGAARASGYIGAANSWNGAIGGVTNAGIDSYLMTKRI